MHNSILFVFIPQKRSLVLQITLSLQIDFLARLGKKHDSSSWRKRKNKLLFKCSKDLTFVIIKQFVTFFRKLF